MTHREALAAQDIGRELIALEEAGIAISPTLRTSTLRLLLSGSKQLRRPLTGEEFLTALNEAGRARPLPSPPRKAKARQ